LMILLACEQESSEGRAGEVMKCCSWEWPLYRWK
jgi:hypothetical protein